LSGTIGEEHDRDDVLPLGTDAGQIPLLCFPLSRVECCSLQEDCLEMIHRKLVQVLCSMVLTRWQNKSRFLAGSWKNETGLDCTLGCARKIWSYQPVDVLLNQAFW